METNFTTLSEAPEQSRGGEVEEEYISMSKAKQTRNERLYQKWLQGSPIKELQKEFGITRQRIYQVLEAREVSEKEKVMRVVNRLSR